MELSATQYEDSLAHYGILRRSGRYPWGSGKTPQQRSRTFLDIIDQHQRDGLTLTKIAERYSTKQYPLTSTDIRAMKTRAVHIKTEEQIRQAERLAATGMGNSAIGREMGVSESTVRSLREPGRLQKLAELHNTADMLKRQVAEKGFIDVGSQVERDLPIADNPETRIGISRDKFNTAISMLKEEGFAVSTLKVPQLGTTDKTTRRVLFMPPKKGMSEKELRLHAFANRDKVALISEKTEDGGQNYQSVAFKKPLNIDPKRVGVRYKEDGGADADGVIYVRPGVHDLSLGKSQYAQVRISVGGTHYLKGMAIYKSDLPSGVDLLFNTNKSDTGNKLDALKKLNKIPLKDDKGNVVKDSKGNVVDSEHVDWKNPFGSFPKLDGGQLLDEHGNVKSAMNILSEQGDWSKWSRTLSSQMLAKQEVGLVKSQLDLTYDRRKQEFEEIRALTNPLIKRKLLETFSDEADSAAVHLKAANMPRQATKVLLPIGSMRPSEVFAPTLPNGTRVALVRFPHAGTFEIPQLVVNNNNKEAQELFRDPTSSDKAVRAPDAIGIHPKVAEILSGADFDGDSVVMIPNNDYTIKSRPALEGLKNFDPKIYKVPTPDEDPVNGRTTIDNPRTKGNEMGKVTNLITDMTIKGAPDSDIAAAVRHSMVVIDAEKHNLDYKASERDNGIIALKKNYQGENPNGTPKGASTLLTRATSEARPDQRKDATLKDEHGNRRPHLVRTAVGTIDERTGAKVYDPTGELNAKGKAKTFRSQKLAETTDAHTLVSEPNGTPVERVYADHSNRLKALANDARKELIATVPKKRLPSAAKIYATEVAELKSALNEALKNKPLERQAQAMANQFVAQRRRANPNMEPSDLKKIKGQALEEARIRTGANKHQIDITDRQWQAIQAGAVSTETLKNILNNTDIEKLRERATPREKPVMTPIITSRAQAMHRAGVSYADIADALGLSVSTVESALAPQ
jgi:DNA-binding CsgD family transcriptional regulator